MDTTSTHPPPTTTTMGQPSMTSTTTTTTGPPSSETQRRRYRRKRKHMRISSLTRAHLKMKFRLKRYNKVLRVYDSLLSKRDHSIERGAKLSYKLGKYINNRNEVFKKVFDVKGKNRTKEKTKHILASNLHSQTKMEAKLKRKFMKKLEEIKRYHEELKKHDRELTIAIAELEDAMLILITGGFATEKAVEDVVSPD